MRDDIFGIVALRLRRLGVAVYGNRSFSQLTTLGCGGKIKLTVYPGSERQLISAVRLLDKYKIRYVFVGRGSNILAADADFDGAAVVTAKVSKVTVRGSKVYASAGTSTAYLAKILCQNGLSGGEFLACLPATVGGAAVCNAGCFGQDMRGILHSVKVMRKGKVFVLPVDKCGYRKRGSALKNGDYLVIGVNLRLDRGNREQIERRIEQIKKTKRDSQPLNGRSAGCALFHDTVAVSALIDRAGLKGYTLGGAQISTKHAGFVLNVDKATGWDIYLILRYIIDTLWQRFGIVAKTELCLVNFTKEQYDILAKG